MIQQSLEQLVDQHCMFNNLSKISTMAASAPPQINKPWTHGIMDLLTRWSLLKRKSASFTKANASIVSSSATGTNTSASESRLGGINLTLCVTQGTSTMILPSTAFLSHLSWLSTSLKPGSKLVYRSYLLLRLRWQHFVGNICMSDWKLPRKTIIPMP